MEKVRQMRNLREFKLIVRVPPSHGAATNNVSLYNLNSALLDTTWKTELYLPLQYNQPVDDKETNKVG